MTAPLAALRARIEEAADNPDLHFDAYQLIEALHWSRGLYTYAQLTVEIAGTVYLVTGLEVRGPEHVVLKVEALPDGE